MYETKWDLIGILILVVFVIFGGIYTIFEDFIYRSFDTYINKAMSSIILTNILLGCIAYLLLRLAPYDVKGR
jgi:hypothetical protein